MQARFSNARLYSWDVPAKDADTPLNSETFAISHNFVKISRKKLPF